MIASYCFSLTKTGAPPGVIGGSSFQPTAYISKRETNKHQRIISKKYITLTDKTSN
jgi:hypothetical protein